VNPARGFALTEIAIVAGTVALLMAGVLGLQQGRRDSALAARTVQEAEAIAEASVRRFRTTGAWPLSVAELATELQGLGNGTNPFGIPYTVSGTGRRVLVTTTVPLANVPTAPGTNLSLVTASGSTTVTVSRTLADRGLTGPAFDKRYLYQE
jgi:type II secretory pathway pseudopilin PulG